MTDLYYLTLEIPSTSLFSDGLGHLVDQVFTRHSDRTGLEDVQYIE